MTLNDKFCTGCNRKQTVTASPRQTLERQVSEKQTVSLSGK